jgi:[NiFe] hydrogenase assembly HybE family chaperone
MPERVAALVGHFRYVADERMRGLPIVNPELEVEAVGFRPIDGHAVGVLIAPWFMNLVVLPGTDEWADAAQGAVVEWELPSGRYELTVCRDAAFGTYLTAVLFRTVMDFPDQATAHDVATEIAAALERPPESDAGGGRKLSRRALFTQAGTS